MLRITAQWYAAGYPILGDVPPGWMPLQVYNSPAHWEVCHILEGSISRESASKEAAQYLALAEANSIAFVESQGGFYIPCSAFVAGYAEDTEMAAIQTVCEAMKSELAVATAACAGQERMEALLDRQAEALALSTQLLQDVTGERDEALVALHEAAAARVDAEAKLVAQVDCAQRLKAGDGVMPGVGTTEDTDSPIVWLSERLSTQATELAKARTDVLKYHDLMRHRDAKIAEAGTALAQALTEKDTLAALLEEDEKIQNAIRDMAKSFDRIFPEFGISETPYKNQVFMMSSIISQIADIAKFGPRAFGDIAIVAQTQFYRAALSCFSSMRSTSHMITGARSALSRLSRGARASPAAKPITTGA